MHDLGMCEGVLRMETEKGEVDYGLVSDKKETKSEVETALIRDCRLNLFSLDQIPQWSDSVSAKYGMSFNMLPQ